MECFTESRTQIKMKEIKTFKVIQPQQKCPAPASNFLKDQRIAVTAVGVLGDIDGPHLPPCSQI